MTRIKDLPKHKRPREKLAEKGVENLADQELLAILIRTGRAGKSALEIAANVLKKYPPEKLVSLKYVDLSKIKGIGSAKACSLIASFEFSRRALGKFDQNMPIISKPKDVLVQFPDLGNKKKEYFVALYLNARHQLIGKETISIGSPDVSMFHPREVFEPAVRFCAVKVVLAHNHPSGEVKPSDLDRLVTKRLVRAGKLLGIGVVDHLIVSSRGYLSMKEEGLL